MIKNTLTLSIITIALTIFTFSCSTEDDDGGTNLTKTQMITNGIWIQYDSKENGVSDWDSYDACDKDDLLQFKTDGTLVSSPGPLKCDPSDPDSYTFPWSFFNNETQIIAEDDTLTIDQLTNSNLTMTEDYDGDTYQIFFRKQ